MKIDVLQNLVSEVEICNKHFSNHVSIHLNEYFRKLIIIVQVGIILALIIV